MVLEQAVRRPAWRRPWYGHQFPLPLPLSQIPSPLYFAMVRDCYPCFSGGNSGLVAVTHGKPEDIVYPFHEVTIVLFVVKFVERRLSRLFWL